MKNRPGRIGASLSASEARRSSSSESSTNTLLFADTNKCASLTAATHAVIWADNRAVIERHVTDVPLPPDLLSYLKVNQPVQSDPDIDTAFQRCPFNVLTTLVHKAGADGAYMSDLKAFAGTKLWYDGDNKPRAVVLALPEWNFAKQDMAVAGRPRQVRLSCERHGVC